jgi:hypothetical protein
VLLFQYTVVLNFFSTILLLDLFFGVDYLHVTAFPFLSYTCKEKERFTFVQNKVEVFNSSYFSISVVNIFYFFWLFQIVPPKVKIKKIMNTPAKPEKGCLVVILKLM